MDSKYVSDYFSESEKAAYKRSHWKMDSKTAYALGVKMKKCTIKTSLVFWNTKPHKI